MSRRASWPARIVLAALLALVPGVAAQAGQDCPALLDKAERLVLVLAPDLGATAATVQFYQREQGGEWAKAGAAKQAVVGKGGLAWSWAFDRLAAKGEPVKTEGDGRTPAGFFAVGKPFGKATPKRAGYVTLREGEHFCVDDPRSSHYNRIVPKAKAGAQASGEDMAAIPLYREGLFLDYPTSRQRKGGSCIFVHVWRRPGAGTVGCVALAEPDVKEMQGWADGGKRTVIAILPQAALARLRGCIPGA